MFIFLYAFVFVSNGLNICNLLLSRSERQRQEQQDDNRDIVGDEEEHDLFGATPAEEERVPDYFRIRRTLQRRIRGTLPPTPQTPLEIKAVFDDPCHFDKFGRTIGGADDTSGQPFYRAVHVEADFSYCIFASTRILNIITTLDEQNYFVDATFKVVPYGPFTQLLIIHCEVFSKVYHIIPYYLHICISDLCLLFFVRPYRSFSL